MHAGPDVKVSEGESRLWPRPFDQNGGKDDGRDEAPRVCVSATRQLLTNILAEVRGCRLNTDRTMRTGLVQRSGKGAESTGLWSERNLRAALAWTNRIGYYPPPFTTHSAPRGR